MEVMKEARKKRKAKKRDLSDAIVVKSCSVMPPYRTEQIIPDKHLTTMREFNSNMADNMKSKKLNRLNASAQGRIFKLNQRILEKLDQGDN